MILFSTFSMLTSRTGADIKIILYELFTLKKLFCLEMFFVYKTKIAIYLHANVSRTVHF